jgi:hypothetical protein
MRSSSLWLAFTIAGIFIGCGDGGAGEGQPADAGAQKVAAERGGTITVGDSSWTIVPSTQCSIYPGKVVSIAGHAAEDESVEIVIDFGGPDQVRIGEGRDAIWHAVRDTIEMSIDGRQVTGTATFTEYSGGGGKSAAGSWDVSC